MHEYEKNILISSLLLLPCPKEHKTNAGEKSEECENNDQLYGKCKETDKAYQSFEKSDNESNKD